MHIGDPLKRRAIYSPDRPAVVDMGKDPPVRLDFRTMNQRADRFANWLGRSAGVNAGDRVAVLARDGIEHLDCFFACSKLGAIHTALNWRLHPRELSDLVRNTTPKVLVYSNDFIETVQSLAADLRTL